MAILVKKPKKDWILLRINHIFTFRIEYLGKVFFFRILLEEMIIFTLLALILTMGWFEYKIIAYEQVFFYSFDKSFFRDVAHLILVRPNE